MRLRRTKDLHQCTIAALDTDIGTVDDFYFDDRQWTIRYMVVGTGIILSGRKVLISGGSAASNLESAAYLCEFDIGTNQAKSRHRSS
ncbi:MAG TPA: PRC-barrel domain-containing protein [Acidobacteriaceae bacterium]|nr:PRC-barrel domain-containing protein [Acidobacteriaceae bacterium]